MYNIAFKLYLVNIYRIYCKSIIYLCSQLIIFRRGGGERAEKYKICLGVTSGINMNEAIDLVICLGVLCPKHERSNNIFRCTLA